MVLEVSGSFLDPRARYLAESLVRRRRRTANFAHVSVAKLFFSVSDDAVSRSDVSSAIFAFWRALSKSSAYHKKHLVVTIILKYACNAINKLHDVCQAISLVNILHIRIVIHTHPFNGPFPGLYQVSRYQKGTKTNLDFSEARYSETPSSESDHPTFSRNVKMSDDRSS